MRKQFRQIKEFVHEKTAYFRERVSKTKLIFFTSLVVCWCLLLLGTRFAFDKTIIPESQLMTTQNFENNSGTITIQNQTYSKKNHLLKLEIETKDASNLTGVDFNHLEWQFFVRNSKQAKMKVVPIMNQRVILYVENLDENFQALSFYVENKAVDTSNVDVEIQDKEATKPTKEKEKNNQTLQFYVTENSKHLQYKTIHEENQTDLSLKVIQKQIKENKTETKRLKESKKVLEKSIKENDKQISKVEEESRFATSAEKEKAKMQLENLEAENKGNEEKIRKAKENIEKIEKEISELQEKISAIESGDFKETRKEKILKMGEVK